MRKQLITIHQKNEPSRTQGLRVCALQYALTFIRFILSAEFFCRYPVFFKCIQRA